MQPGQEVTKVAHATYNVDWKSLFLFTTPIYTVSIKNKGKSDSEGAKELSGFSFVQM